MSTNQMSVAELVTLASDLVGKTVLDTETSVVLTVTEVKDIGIGAYMQFEETNADGRNFSWYRPGRFVEVTGRTAALYMQMKAVVALIGAEVDNLATNLGTPPKVASGLLASVLRDAMMDRQNKSF